MSAEQRTDAGETGGQFLRRLRKARGLTPEALADSVGVSRVTVDRWEKDARIPQRGRRGRLARSLAISEPELLDGLQLTPHGSSSAATNVVHLRPAADASSHPVPRAMEEYTPDHRRLLEVILAGLESERACSSTWLSAAAATARMIGLDWNPTATESGPSQT